MWAERLIRSPEGRIGEKGGPKHRRGVSAEPGIYFLRLPWQSRHGSSFIWGVRHDAKYLADHIATQRKYLAYEFSAPDRAEKRAAVRDTGGYACLTCRRLRTWKRQAASTAEIVSASAATQSKPGAPWPRSTPHHQPSGAMTPQKHTA